MGWGPSSVARSVRSLAYVVASVEMGEVYQSDRLDIYEVKLGGPAA